jgi:hypothetical protein
MGAQLVGFNPKKEMGTWNEINLTKVRRMKKGKLQGKTDTGYSTRNEGGKQRYDVPEECGYASTINL